MVTLTEFYEGCMKRKAVDDKIVDISIAGQGVSVWKINKKIACSARDEVLGAGLRKPI